MVNEVTKKAVLKQIDEFVNYQNSSKEPKRYELKLCVPTDVARERAAFFGYIHDIKKFNCDRVIDLTFGSANLTSHLLLDNNIDFSKLVFNDKNINDSNNSLEVKSIATEVTNNDILNSSLFSNDIFNIIIFNPQFGGGSYPEGELGVKRLNDEGFIFYKYEVDLETALRERLNLTSQTDYTITIDEDKRTILIHSDSLLAGKMDNLFSKIKVFNYYDIFYQSKENAIRGEESNLVKFRKTFHKISNEYTTVVFFGKQADYELFFSDFNECYIYMGTEKDKSLTIGRKNDTDVAICYERDVSSFIEAECTKSSVLSFNDESLEELLIGIDQHLKEFEQLNSEGIFSTDTNEVQNQSEHINIVQGSDTLTKPRFKNFLIDYITKETK